MWRLTWMKIKHEYVIIKLNLFNIKLNIQNVLMKKKKSMKNK